MKFIVDRIVGEVISLESEAKEIVEVSYKLLPRDIKEGDVIDIRIDKEETKKREESIRKLMDDVWED